MRTRFLPIGGAIALLSCVLAGCGGDSFDRVPLSGTVTCEGMASVNGGILATSAQAGTSAPNVSAPITDGKFSFPAGQGPVAGSYIFEISLQIPGAKPPPGQSPEGEVETGPEVDLPEDDRCSQGRKRQSDNCTHFRRPGRSFRRPSVQGAVKPALRRSLDDPGHLSANISVGRNSFRPSGLKSALRQERGLAAEAVYRKADHERPSAQCVWCSPQEDAQNEATSVAKLPVRRKLLYAALTTAAFFGLLELTLLAFRVDPAAQQFDPYLSFSGQSRLFTETGTASGRRVLVTAENRLEFFNRQSFLRDKPPDGYRIFCLGGSTTYGHPYDDRTSFAGFLRAFLPEMDPSRQWEVINAGGISYASYRIAVLSRELVQYQPDLFVIYTGHNEFLEDRTYSSLIDTPEPIRRAVGLARWSRTFSLAQRLLRGTPASRDRPTLPAEVDALLDRAVGPGAYHRDDRRREQVLAHFRSALRQIVEIARRRRRRSHLGGPGQQSTRLQSFQERASRRLDE